MVKRNRHRARTSLTLLPGDREALVRALLLWRYIGHRRDRWPDNANALRAERALRIAGQLGLAKEYMAAVMEWPILTVKVKEWPE